MDEEEPYSFNTIVESSDEEEIIPLSRLQSVTPAAEVEEGWKVVTSPRQRRAEKRRVEEEQRDETGS